LVKQNGLYTAKGVSGADRMPNGIKLAFRPRILEQKTRQKMGLSGREHGLYQV
jgi:hypothetical protein